MRMKQNLNIFSDLGMDFDLENIVLEHRFRLLNSGDFSLKNACHFVYIRFVESGKSETRQGSAARKCISTVICSFGKIASLHFPRSRLRGASEYQLFPRK